MLITEVEKEALKLVLACDKLRQKYHADGVKVYLTNAENFTIKLIAEEHVVRTIRIGKNNSFDIKRGGDKNERVKV